MTSMRRAAVLALVALVLAVPAAAEVIRLDITSREPYAADAPGRIGPYERLRGRVVYALDPDHEANARIVDLAAAAPNEAGRVEFYADIEILVPVDRSLAQPTVLYEVNNRGRRLWGADPFLLSRGYVMVSSGWIAEVPVSPDLLRLEAPVANDDDGVNVVGTVRADFVTDAPAERLRVSGQLSYEPIASSVAEATLTRRLREMDAPELVARDRWRLLVTEPPREEGSGLVELQVDLDGGFEPGVVYELIYEARGAVVQGAGFAAIRDLVSLLKHDTSALNPLRGADGRPLAERVIGQGLSQSGRALRMFLYDGFNADEQGRQVFDGVMPVIAGGGQGFFNHRFASPTRTNTQHSGHLYPADVFPFTYGGETDPFTGRSDGILRRARASGTLPKVIHLDSASEYWHRSGSLVVTDPAGERDSVIPAGGAGIRLRRDAARSGRAPARPRSAAAESDSVPAVPAGAVPGAGPLAHGWHAAAAERPSAHCRRHAGRVAGGAVRVDAAAECALSDGHPAAGAARLRQGVREAAPDRPAPASADRQAVRRARARARQGQQRAGRAADAVGRGTAGHLHRVEPAQPGHRGAR